MTALVNFAEVDEAGFSHDRGNHLGLKLNLGFTLVEIEVDAFLNRPPEAGRIEMETYGGMLPGLELLGVDMGLTTAARGDRLDDLGGSLALPDEPEFDLDRFEVRELTQIEHFLIELDRKLQ